MSVDSSQDLDYHSVGLEVAREAQEDNSYPSQSGEDSFLREEEEEEEEVEEVVKAQSVVHPKPPSHSVVPAEVVPPVKTPEANLPASSQVTQDKGPSG